LNSQPEQPSHAEGVLKPEKSAGRRVLERATIAGLGFSLATHLIIMIIAALVTVDFAGGDAGGGDGAAVDFAVLTDAQLAQTSSPKVQHESFEVAAIETAAPTIDMLADAAAENSVDELADSLAPSLNPGGGSLTSIDSAVGASGAGSGDGASFFGLEAKGRRFAYIVDVSGSMDMLTGEGAVSRWELTRAELIRSIAQLDEHAKFSIILYSSNAISLFGEMGWVDATDANRRTTVGALMGFEPRGGTQPEPAFEMIFGLKPEPDAVYFMTDGKIPTGAPTRVRSMNRRELVPIHCILFGELANERDARAASNMMSNIARNSGGKFTHIREGRP